MFITLVFPALQRYELRYVFAVLDLQFLDKSFFSCVRADSIDAFVHRKKAVWDPMSPSTIRVSKGEQLLSLLFGLFPLQEGQQ